VNARPRRYTTANGNLACLLVLISRDGLTHAPGKLSEGFRVCKESSFLKIPRPWHQVPSHDDGPVNVILRVMVSDRSRGMAVSISA
jgi:hypothetical protein